MVTTFVGFIYNEFQATSFGYYALLLLVGTSAIESSLGFVKILNGSVAEGGLNWKNKLIWTLISIGVKVSMVYLIFHNYL